MTAPLGAVVFDCDGTLADTEPISDRAWTDVLGGYGYTPTREDALATIGLPFDRTFGHFSTKAALGDPVVFRRALRERFLARLDTELSVFEDAVGVLREVAATGFPVAVASSSSRSHVERILARGQITELVTVVVGAEDVARHKPHPEPYLLAATKLGVPPQRCRAVEDTAVGVASAQAAGMYTVAVVRGHQTAADLLAADRVVEVLTFNDLEPTRWTR